MTEEQKDALASGFCAVLAVVILLGLLFFPGCAHQSGGLKSDAVERVCINEMIDGQLVGECYLRGEKEIVNRRCTRGKLTWDDGSKFDPADESVYARCCTVLVNPSVHRYQYWVTKGEEECWAHERGHVRVWERDGHKFFAEHHKRLHEFGLGRPKKSL